MTSFSHETMNEEAEFSYIIGQESRRYKIIGLPVIMRRIEQEGQGKRVAYINTIIFKNSIVLELPS